MKNFLNPRNAILAFSIVGLSGIAISGFASQASASILDECHASSKIKVVACCKQHIEHFGHPIWMSNGEDNNCKAVAVCAGKKYGGSAFASVAYVKPKLPCFLQPSVFSDDDGNKLGNPPGRKPNAGKP